MMRKFFYGCLLASMCMFMHDGLHAKKSTPVSKVSKKKSVVKSGLSYKICYIDMMKLEGSSNITQDLMKQQQAAEKKMSALIKKESQEERSKLLQSFEKKVVDGQMQAMELFKKSFDSFLESVTESYRKKGVVVLVFSAGALLNIKNYTDLTKECASYMNKSYKTKSFIS